MTTATPRHGYALVGQEDAEDLDSSAKELKLNKPTRFRRECCTPRFLVVCIIGTIVGFGLLKSFQFQGRRNRGNDIPMPVEPGFFGGGFGGGSIEVDEKLRHRYPVLTDSVKLTPTEALEANRMFFESYKLPETRFRSHIILDKPVYRPGEVLRGSCFIFNGFNGRELNIGGASASIVIKDPKDVVIANEYSQSMENGVIAFQWTVPSNIAGGDFKLSVVPQAYPKTVASAERKFEVRSTQQSNAKMRKRLEFRRDGYSSGDQVTVEFSTDPSEEETLVKFTAIVDSMEVASSDFSRLPGTSVEFSFNLPSKLSRGEGTVIAKVQRGGLFESTSKTIPIITQRLDVGLYPESGVLVPGLKQRVYVEASDAVTGNPVDFSADVFSDLDTKTPIATIQSLHEGRGRSDYFIVPINCKRVYLKVTSPSGAAGQTEEFPLRVLKDLQQSVSFTLDSVTFGDELSVRVVSSQPESYIVQLFKLENEISKIKAKVDTKKIEDSVTFFTKTVDFDLGKNDAYGVFRVTISDNYGIPVAERLAFRMPPRALEIELSGVTLDDVSDEAELTGKRFTKDSLFASPSDGLGLKVKTWTRSINRLTGEFTGKRVPVSATVSLRVTDAALCSTVDSRLLPPRLPEAVLLESEVFSLSDAGQYLSGTKWGWQSSEMVTNKKSRGTFADRLDVLLGTQGWRMFAYYDVNGFATQGKAPLLREALTPAGALGSNERDDRSVTSPVDEDALYRLFVVGKQPRFPVMMAMAAAAPRVQFAKARGFEKENLMDVHEVNLMKMHEEDHIDGQLDEAYEEPAENHDENDNVEGAPPGESDDDYDDYSADEKPPRNPVLERAVPMIRSKFVPPPPFMRIYAHPQRKYLKKEFKEGAKRSDFTQTVYNNPSLVTQCSGDECASVVKFGLSDSSSTVFIAHADGFVPQQPMTLGCGTMTISTEAPLEVDFTVPPVIVSGDRPLIPITVQNRLPLSVAIELKSSFTPRQNFKFKSPNFRVEAGRNGARIYAELVASNEKSSGKKDLSFNLTIAAAADGSNKDSVTRTATVVSKGFPQSQHTGGTLRLDPSRFTLTLPQDYVPNTLRITARAFTSPLGRLNKALEALIKEPCGCFEQTSSTTYPLVFVLQYLKTHSGSSYEMIKKAEDMLRKGYGRLVSYESPGGGFEWFGQAPGHEALTAYGLLQFAAMADPVVGIDVDRAMVERTKKWMDSRRDGKGGFLRNERALDSFGAAPEVTTNAYITWALVRAGLLRSKKRDPEIEYILNKVRDESDSAFNDPYIVALAALALFDATEPSNEQIAEATSLADRLALMQDEDGALRRGTVDTITRSRGDALELEATALGVLVWLHDSAKYAVNARSAIDFVALKCTNGRFSSTQSTALSLMAIVEFDRVFSKPLPLGAIEISVNGKPVQTLRFGGIKKPKEEGIVQDGKWAASLLGGADGDCKGGSEWTDCGSNCPLTCEEPEERPCTLQCVPRCKCPQEKPYMTYDGICIAECTASAISDVDEEGVLLFDGDKLLSSLAFPSGKSEALFSVKMILDDKDSAKEPPTIPYALSFEYSVIKPNRNPKFKTAAPLEFSVALDTLGAKTSPTEGDIVTLRAILKNISKDVKGNPLAVPMVVAVIGIPGGFEPRVDQLREIKQSKIVDFVESEPGRVILYWRALKPDAVVEIPVQITAIIPGVYSSPSSRAYLYYNDEDKIWADGFKVKIDPRQSPSIENLFW